MTGPMWMPTAPPTLHSLLAWHPQPIPVFPVGCLIAAVLYATGVIRLARRGDGWPMGRILAFLAGLVSVVAVTGTGLGGYGMRLFSAHMVQHMVLAMLSPILLLLGAPITLALRVLSAGGRPRRVLVAALHSRVAGVFTAPWLTLPLFVVSLYGLYFTPVFDAAMSTWWGHVLMLGHFLAVGLLFFLPILAIDPLPRRTGHPGRILELIASIPFHAFFGIIVMMSTRLVVGFFTHPPAAWHITAIGDQSTAGGIAWGFTEIPTALVLVVVVAGWARASEREARRRDRAADRDCDAALAEYNRYLASLPS